MERLSIVNEFYAPGIRSFLAPSGSADLELTSTINSLVEAHLLEDIGHQHDVTVPHALIKSFFRERLGEDESRKLHLELADYLAGLPVAERPKNRASLLPLIERFGHLLEGGRFQDAAEMFIMKKPLGKGLYELGHFREIIAMLQDYLSHTGDHPPPHVLHNLGLVYRKLGNLTLSDECFVKLLFQAENSKPIVTSEYAWYMSHRTFIQAYLGRFAEAVEMLRKAIEICESEGRQTTANLEPLQRGWLGSFLAGLGILPEALSELTASIGVSRELKDRRHECHSLIQRGDLYLRLGYEWSARSDHEKALEIAVEDGLEDFRAHAQRGLGDDDRRVGEFERAAEHYEQARIICEDTGTLYTLAEVFISKARLMAEQGLDEELETLLESAPQFLNTRKQELDRSEYRVQLLECYLLQARLASRQGKERKEVFSILISKAEPIYKEIDHFWARTEYEVLLERFYAGMTL